MERLRRGFIEVLAATSETPLTFQLRQALARYACLHLVALSHADLDAQRVRLTQSGFAMQEVVRLRRPAQTAGVSPEVSWSVLRTEPGVMAESRVQFVTSHTPELSWPPGSTISSTPRA
jgi:hypothetical protein